MPIKCPHCSENVEDAYSKDETQRMIRERVSSKDEEIKTVKAERDEATRKVLTADQRIERAERVAVNAAFQSAGVADDATIRRGFELFYNEATGGKEDGDKPTYAEWIVSEDAKKHPMLSTHFANSHGGSGPKDPPADPANPPKDPPADPANTPGGPPSPPPNANAGATNPPDQKKKMSPDDLATYFRSDEFRALSREDQKAQFDKMKAEHGLGTLFNTDTVVRSVLPPKAPQG